MLEVGYLDLDSPIAILCPSDNLLDSNNALQFSSAPGLIMLEDIDLDQSAISTVETSLNTIKTQSRLAFSLTCSNDGPLVEAARLAARNLYLMEIDATKGWDDQRLKMLVENIKRCGTTLSVRLAPKMITGDLVITLKKLGLDILHLDLHGMNGTAPKVVRKISDEHGPRIMAMGDVGDFEDAKSLLSMGADLVSLQGPDPEFASWLSQTMKECDHLSGWYNAPKHICSGGDLRGLAFCCPPIKHCPVLGALRRTGMSQEMFVQRKLELAKGTLLESGKGTCFGSLVWCCKASKPCYLRDAALERIGLSSRDYMQLKKKLADQLLNQ